MSWRWVMPRYRSRRTGRYYIGGYDVGRDRIWLQDEITGAKLVVAGGPRFFERFQEVE